MAWDGKDRSVAGLRSAKGGFVPEAVGCTFAGKKPGTWRRIKRLGRNGHVIYWESETRRSGCCQINSFLSQINRSQPVALPGEDLDCDILRSTIKMLREKGYSKEQIVSELEDA